jgi:hypothetical protein
MAFIFSVISITTSMKSLLTALVLSTMTVPAFAGTAHDTCLQAADYEGCMRVQTNGGIPTSSNDSLSNLRAAMKQVAARLTAGTSLRDSSEVFRPVTDALAVVPPADQTSTAYIEGKQAATLFSIWQDAWQGRIAATSYSRYGPDTYQCEYLKQTADQFDRASGTSMNWNFKKGLLGSKFCKVRAGQLPEQYMRPVVIRRLEQASIDPKVIAAQEAESARQRERAELTAWERHLEETPGLKAWAKANPALAQQKRKEWAAKNPTAVKSIPFPTNPISIDY